ncbi:MAG: hypothetical protein ACK46X_19265 [Candidatus Sericytochromatia bacterium]
MDKIEHLIINGSWPFRQGEMPASRGFPAQNIFEVFLRAEKRRHDWI